MNMIETKNGYVLTLRERQIMKLIIDEVQDRLENWSSSEIQTEDQELTNVRLLIGDYIAAYKQGRLTLSDIERCG